MDDRLIPSLIEVTLLAAWLGAAALFGAVVAPALFALLPTRTLAGAIVGRVLPFVFYSGVLIGGIVIGLEVTGRRAWAWRGREALGLAMLAACALAQLVVAPRIERLRIEIGGPLEGLSLTDARRLAFGRLHGVSVGFLGLAMLAAAAALLLAARTLQARN